MIGLHPNPHETFAVIPTDPTARYHTITLFMGLWATLITGEHAVEGRFIRVARPDMFSENPAPVVTIDTGHGLIVGPVLEGDIIAEPTPRAA